MEVPSVFPVTRRRVTRRWMKKGEGAVNGECAQLLRVSVFVALPAISKSIFDLSAFLADAAGLDQCSPQPWAMSRAS